VVVTGTDTSDLKAADFASVLRKPLHPDHLLSAVENCIGRNRQFGSYL
jgi:hypothetical protein